MNDEKLIEEIKTYQMNPLKYALMIEGKWGSGKTYFIENKLNEMKPIYVSLYSANSISNIVSQILFQVINTEKFNGKLKKSEELVGSASNIITAYIEAKFNISTSDIFKFSRKIDLKSKLIVFDDLERSNLPIKEVLGFINNLVEHNNVKAVIIANEDEIKDDNYKKYKEKIIYQTFKYYPNIEEIYDNISKSEADVVKKEKDFVLEELKRKNHLNIRTIQFIIQRYKELNTKIEPIISKVVNPELFESVRKNIFDYFAIVSIMYKNGDDLPEIEDDKEISHYNLYKSILVPEITSFKFINNYVLGNEIDIIKVEKALKDYSDELLENIHTEDNPLQILDYWWEAEDDVIEKSTTQIIDGLKNNEYSYSLYPNILAFLIDIENIGFCVENYTDIMKNNITNEKNEVMLGHRLLDNARDEIKEIYYKKRKELEEFVEKHNAIIKKENILNIRDQSIGNMGRYLLNYCSGNDSYFRNKKKLIGEIGIENILYVVKNGNNEDIRYLVYLFYDKYRYADVAVMYPEDKVLLIQLKEEIEKMDTEGFSKMKQYSFKSFIECITTIVNDYYKE